LDHRLLELIAERANSDETAKSFATEGKQKAGAAFGSGSLQSFMKDGVVYCRKKP
jgi:hypothetical protein